MAAMISTPTTGRARTVSVDVTASMTAQGGFDDFRREWEAQVGEPWPLNGLDAAASTDFKINVQAVSAHDVVIADVYSASYTGRTVPDHETDGWVLLHRLRRGSWRFGQPDRRGEDVTVPAGSFIVRHDGPSALFDLAGGSRADVLFLPAPAVAPLLPGGRPILGSARLAEVRVLMAHAHTVRETVRDLTPAGSRAARDALLELAKGVMRSEFDDVEPRLAPALARAAMEIADRCFADPDLTPAALARQLNVSVRTLHRAFAAAGETVAAYIRRGRLEQARLELEAPPLRRPGVSEVAARYHFADGSHFARAFKARYGQTPAEFARTSRGEAGAGTGSTRRSGK
jgi:AraC family transcriptional regulator, positive regulator of tynA and feaB